MVSPQSHQKCAAARPVPTTLDVSILTGGAIRSDPRMNDWSVKAAREPVLVHLLSAAFFVRRQQICGLTLGSELSSVVM